MKKMKKQAGFTLAELLIVVAIIAILVAIGIPMFNTAMEKSRETADVSNLRAAKAAGAVLHMDGMTVPYTKQGESEETAAQKIPSYGYLCFYDISTGVLLDKQDKKVTGESSKIVLKAAGKGTALAGTQPKEEVLMTDGTNEYKPTSNVSNGYIAVLILPSDKDSPVQVTFVKSVDDVEPGTGDDKPASFDKDSKENNMLKTDYPAAPADDDDP